MGKVIKFRKVEPCPTELEWAIPLIEYQDTQEFKDWSGYHKAVGEQRALEKIAKRQQKNSKESVGMRE